MRKILRLIRLVLRDKWIAFKEGSHERLYGVYMFVGEVGEGKTVSMVQHLEDLRKKDPRIKIYTNFFYQHESGRIEHWKDMLKVPSYSVIAIDEVQNTFDQRSWSSFPPALVPFLTQNRKFGDREDGRPPGIRLLLTTQDYDNTDVMIRRLTNYVITCSSYFSGRLIFNRLYKRKVYEMSEQNRKNIRLDWIVGSDDLRNVYDTYKLLDSLKGYEKDDSKKVRRTSSVS